jgi:hypothetical protein
MDANPSREPSESEKVGPPGDLRNILWISICILLLLTLVAFAMPLAVARINAQLPSPNALSPPDLVLLPLFCLAVLMFGQSKRLGKSLLMPRHFLVFTVAGLFALCVWGHRAILWGVDLSRDEQMAVFDAAIFRSGHLTAPIPILWRSIAPALNLEFILPIGDHTAWASAYLPVNAMLRALVATMADPVITSPLLVVIGFLALAAIARRLWPESPGSQLAALLCYIGSSQIVITGMTAFAMSAHLAFNLVWLMLFLRGDRIGFAGTLLIGFLATGAHQPLFHPLFALPFLAQAFRQEPQHWRRFAGYGLGYALIIGFWLAWPVWLSGLAGVVPRANNREGIDFLTRLLSELAKMNVSAFWTMAANLIRFVTWQHLLLLPLMLLGAIGGWRRWLLVRPLAIGIVLPILIMGLILPWQGHGWGYRYLHPVLGNACLLAGFGWYHAEAKGLDLRKLMLWTTIVSVFVLLPLRCVTASAMSEQQAVPDRAIAHLDADIAVIDSTPFSHNLVINAADLSNRPIRVGGKMLQPRDMASLCRGRRTTFVDAPQLYGLNRFYHEQGTVLASQHQLALRTAAAAAGCNIVSGDTSHPFTPEASPTSVIRKH